MRTDQPRGPAAVSGPPAGIPPLCAACGQRPVWRPGALTVIGRICRECFAVCYDADRHPRPCPVCEALGVGYDDGPPALNEPRQVGAP